MRLLMYFYKIFFQKTTIKSNKSRHSLLTLINIQLELDLLHNFSILLSSFLLYLFILIHNLLPLNFIFGEVLGFYSFFDPRNKYFFITIVLVVDLF